MKATTRFKSRACAMALKRAGQGSTRVSRANVARTRTIAEVRSDLEETKAEWQDITEEAIADHFRRHPGQPFHADDLLSLGIPEEHRRSIVGSAIALWVNKRRMEECGRRKSIAPSRNGAKSNEYRLTEKGRDFIAGDGAGNRSRGLSRGFPPAGGDASPPASAVAGDENSSGREAVTSSTASRPGESGDGGTACPSRAARSVGSSPPAGAASPEPSVAEDLAATEGQLFESVPMAPHSAYHPNNEFA